MAKQVLVIVFTGIFLVFSSALSAQCKAKPIVKKCMPLLSPYQYDSYAVKEIVYGPKPKKEVLEFSVFSEEKYKLVFGKSDLPQEVEIIIYNMPPAKKGRKILYFDESGKKGNFAFNFQPSQTGIYYIEYSIPAATAPDQKGCFVLLIGIDEE